MADEARVNVSFTLNLDHLSYIAQPTNYSADVSLANGPSPGAVTVGVLGTDIDFSQLVQPGLCWMQNLDETNWVEYGIWDNDNDKFFPLGELLPGEIVPIRLARNLTQEFGDADTGTGGGAVNRLRFRANTAPCIVRVDAFDT